MDKDNHEREEKIELLVELFEILDIDNSGGIDLHEMQLLGAILSGNKALPTLEETMEQLQMADRDNDLQVDLGEWLQFSEPLLLLPHDDFNHLLISYLDQVRKSLLPDGTRYVKKEEVRYQKLPPLLSSGSSKQLVEANKETQIIETKRVDDCTSVSLEEIPQNKPQPKSLCKEVAKRKGLKISTDVGGSEIHPSPPTSVGWFWGVCSKCRQPAKIFCDKCKSSFCKSHSTEHLLEHVEKIAIGEEAADSPDKDSIFAESLDRVDSRLGFFSDSLSEKQMGIICTDEANPVEGIMGITQIDEEFDDELKNDEAVNSHENPETPNASVKDNIVSDLENKDVPCKAIDSKEQNDNEPQEQIAYTYFSSSENNSLEKNIDEKIEKMSKTANPKITKSNTLQSSLLEKSAVVKSMDIDENLEGMVVVGMRNRARSCIIS